MAKLHFIAISCSADASVIDSRNLYVWGEFGTARWLPDTKKEAKRRIEQCRLKNHCSVCDAEMHYTEVERTKEIRDNL